MTYDPELLRAIEPRQVAAWLRSNGWELVDTQPNRVAVYRLPVDDDDEFVVEVALNPAFRDYPRRTAEVLDTLVASSGHPFAWVLGELRAATVDIVRLRTSGPAITSGRVPVEFGTKLFVLTRELLLAAACSAHDARPVYRTRKPAEAMEFLRKVKLAAPAEGSFVITVHAPVPPALQPALIEGFEDEPFERRSTMMLAQASTAAKGAAESAVLGAGAGPFVGGTANGISANLCEALAGFVDGDHATRLDLHFAWAPSRVVPEGTPLHVQLNSDHAAVLREGARVLRARAPTPDFELEGIVVRLDSEAPQDGGEVVVTGHVEGQPRKIRILMGADDYALALRAHEGQHFLRCEGELVRSGRRFKLERVRHVELVEDEGTDE